MEFRILGPVEVCRNGLRVDIGHARQRAVLAVLVLDLNHAVPTEYLIDRVWGDIPPRSARNILSGYVTRLRSAAVREVGPEVSLVRRAGGYCLEADPECVDVWRFRRGVCGARLAGEDDERASTLFARALSNWQGSALAGLSSPWLSAMREALELEHLAVLLDLNDVALRRGQHATLVSELSALAIDHPADERLLCQLMLALYRSGRVIEALGRFDTARKWLAEEFGADIGLKARSLHQQILRSDSSLTCPGFVV